MTVTGIKSRASGGELGPRHSFIFPSLSLPPLPVSLPLDPSGWKRGWDADKAKQQTSSGAGSTRRRHTPALHRCTSFCLFPGCSPPSLLSAGQVCALEACGLLGRALQFCRLQAVRLARACPRPPGALIFKSFLHATCAPTPTPPSPSASLQRRHPTCRANLFAQSAVERG